MIHLGADDTYGGERRTITLWILAAFLAAILIVWWEYEHQPVEPGPSVDETVRSAEEQQATLDSVMDDLEGRLERLEAVPKIR